MPALKSVLSPRNRQVGTHPTPLTCPRCSSRTNTERTKHELFSPWRSPPVEKPMSYCHDLVSVEALRARIAALEGTWQHATASDLDRRQSALPAAPFGLPPVDRALPWGGLPTACLHELTAAAPADGSAAGFAATLLVRLGE